jgi:predicted transcriptional regulator
MTQTEVAEKADVSRTVVARLEKIRKISQETSIDQDA